MNITKNIYEKRECDFNMMFVPQYQAILADLRKDIAEIKESLQEAELLNNNMMVVCYTMDIHVMQQVEKSYQSLLQKVLN